MKRRRQRNRRSGYQGRTQTDKKTQLSTRRGSIARYSNGTIYFQVLDGPFAETEAEPRTGGGQEKQAALYRGR